MEHSDRDRLLLAFASLASHAIAARPAMASGAAGLAAELGARRPGGLGSYVFWHRDDDASSDPTGTLTAALTLHWSGHAPDRPAQRRPPPADGCGGRPGAAGSGLRRLHTPTTAS